MQLRKICGLNDLERSHLYVKLCGKSSTLTVWSYDPWLTLLFEQEKKLENSEKRVHTKQKIGWVYLIAEVQPAFFVATSNRTCRVFNMYLLASVLSCLLLLIFLDHRQEQICDILSILYIRIFYSLTTLRLQ